MLLSTILLQAAATLSLGKIGAALGAAIAALAAALGISKIGQATMEASARQPEKADNFRMTAIIRRISFRAFSFWQIGTCRNIDICINSAKNICLQSPFPLCYLNPVERRNT